jgi:hypothetical protein
MLAILDDLIDLMWTIVDASVCGPSRARWTAMRRRRAIRRGRRPRP